MRHIWKTAIAASIIIAAGCNKPRNDPAFKEQRGSEIVESENNQKFQGKTEQDADFVAKLVASNYEEIKIAQLGVERGSDAQLKKVAGILETSHSRALNELKTLAQAKAISIPVEETSEAKDRITKLSNAGKDFDRQWCKEIMERHEDTIDELESRQDETEDAALKAWISKVLPEMQAHLQQIKACHDNMKTTESN